MRRTSQTRGPVADFEVGDKKSQGISGSDFAGIGVQFAVVLLGGLFLGQWLDKRFGTSPVLTIGCLFVGAAAAFYSMYRKLMAANAAEDAARNARKGK